MHDRETPLKFKPGQIVHGYRFAPPPKRTRLCLADDGDSLETTQPLARIGQGTSQVDIPAAPPEAPPAEATPGWVPIFLGLLTATVVCGLGLYSIAKWFPR